MNKKFGTDMTVGSIPRHLLKLSIPMLIGNFLQTLYSIVDTIWVGKTVGDYAVGAAGVSFPILFILIAIASGATIATTILVSQFYGAKNHPMVERVVNNSFTLSLGLCAILSISGFLLADKLLALMNTAPEIFAMASSYLKINIAGFTLLYFGFLIASILRGIGDTVTPLIFMAVGTVINAILDPLMIMGIGPFPKLGLDGAAYASLISQFISVVISLIYLNRKNHFVAFNPKKFTFDRKISVLILKIGFPAMLQQSLVSFGFAFVTSFINAFGADASAAFGAANKIDNIAFMPAMSLGMASSALTGQNLGAKKPERVKEVFKWGMLMTISITLLVSLASVVMPETLLRMFVDKPEVLSIGSDYLRIVGASYVLFAVMFVSNGIINGAGHTLVTMVFTIITFWIIRIPLAALLIKTSLGISGIWVAIMISFIVTTAISLLYYRSGKWKQEVIHRG